MADIIDKLLAEAEQVEDTIRVLTRIAVISETTPLERAGIAALLHNFYNGIENILKQILADKNIPLPNSSAWHKELLELAEKSSIIKCETRLKLGPYLAFRHYFIHGYSIDIKIERIVPLINDVTDVWARFKSEIKL
jgi:uncharacterized protein YutE (UPF0331/DUF86 family)